MRVELNPTPTTRQQVLNNRMALNYLDPWQRGIAQKYILYYFEGVRPITPEEEWLILSVLVDTKLALEDDRIRGLFAESGEVD